MNSSKGVGAASLHDNLNVLLAVTMLYTAACLASAVWGLFLMCALAVAPDWSGDALVIPLGGFHVVGSGLCCVLAIRCVLRIDDAIRKNETSIPKLDRRMGVTWCLNFAALAFSGEIYVSLWGEFDLRFVGGFGMTLLCVSLIMHTFVLFIVIRSAAVRGSG